MTAGRLLTDMANPALDQDGTPYPGAKLYFYANGTTTEQDVFTDNTLGTALSNPVVADGNGRFPEIWGDLTDIYSIKFTTSANQTIYTFDDISPLTAGVTGTGGGITDADAFRTALGLGTAAVEDTGESGNTVPFLDGENTWEGANDFTDGLSIDGIDAGYLGIPPVTHDADFTLQRSGLGKRMHHTSASAHTWTIPTEANGEWEDGDSYLLRNTGAGVVTLHRAASVTLRQAGASTNADVDMAQWGMACLTYEGSDSWVVTGVGLT